MSRLLDRLPDALRELHGFGIVNDTDIYLVDSLNRRLANDKAGEWSQTAACLTSAIVSRGHICLSLRAASPAFAASLANDDAMSADVLSADTHRVLKEICTADPDKLIEEGKGILSSSDDKGPFVLQEGRIYLRRYWLYEKQVAERLIEMSGTLNEPTNADLLEERLGTTNLKDGQKEAVRAAMQRRLTIISGGPGTGKTYTAAYILALLMEQVDSEHTPDIRMAAPTGKAAELVGRGLREAMARTTEGDQSKVHDFEDASTIDRMLGFKPDSPYFKHDRDNPLRAEVVLVDEASMIDLPKMAKLLDALEPNCRLVLLGDMHQLASVDPGRVLADLCAAQELSPCVVELTESTRFGKDSPVGRLAKAINKAETAEDAVNAWTLLEKLADDSYGDKRIVQHDVPEYLTDKQGRADPDLKRVILEGYGDFCRAKTPPEAFEALTQFRMLCALRRGPHGVKTINKLIENILPLKTGKEFYDHRIIMITRNDYSTGLFNGDVGVVLPDDKDPNRMVAWFPGKGATEGNKEAPPRKFSCRLLPEHETAFAMTIHKSQGSEFDNILVLLPRSESPILTRELVYTAITRTGKGVQLWTRKDVFTQAISKQIERLSGLRERLDSVK